jgi:hypothetical protein
MIVRKVSELSIGIRREDAVSQGFVDFCAGKRGQSVFLGSV